MKSRLLRLLILMGSNHLNKIFTSALVGTSAMTVFSYLVSDAKKENFREPEVLAQMITKLVEETKIKNAEIEGWIIHYVIGIIFNVIYVQLWNNKITPSNKSGLFLGAASGALGILAWQLAFKIHPDPPVKNLKKYFGHLFVAHLIFGVFSAIGNNLTQKKNETK